MYFPSSCQEIRVSVYNHYFGVLTNGEVKLAHRRDIPFWVKKIQLEVLNCMAKANSLDEVADYLSEAIEMASRAKRDLRNGHVSLEELVVTQSLSRAVEGYTSPSPVAQAAMQLQATGLNVAPGQFMRFVFIRGKERVRAWELGVDYKKILCDVGSGSICACGYVKLD